MSDGDADRHGPSYIWRSCRTRHRETERPEFMVISASTEKPKSAVISALAAEMRLPGKAGARFGVLAPL
jgi:hypothetical protein